MALALLLLGTRTAVEHRSAELASSATASGAVAPRSTGEDTARPARGRAPAPPGTPEGAPPPASEAITPVERPPAPADLPPPEDFGAVVVQRPAVRVDGVTAEDPLSIALGHPAVRFATVVGIAHLPVPGADGQAHEVRVAVVDPRGFRVFTPQVTADAVGVWQHLVDGAAVVEHAAAGRLGVGLGGAIALPDRRPLPVGAIAAIGHDPVADVVMSAATALDLGIATHPSLLVSLTDGSRPSRVASELGSQVGGHGASLVPDRVIELGVTSVSPEQWDDVWDRLAWCESSGRWHLDSGNGYYGGLQFLPSSWWWVGGAGMPHEASREEQIARAKILLAYQGWEAWPVCSRLLGFR